VARRAATELASELDAPGAVEMCGMLHLTAALSAAALRRPTESADHLAEAAELAERLDTDVSPFNNTFFGRVNIGFWRMALAVEAGDGGRAVEIARQVDPTLIPSPGRQAAYWTDLGRGLAMDRHTRPHAVGALLRAEKLDPLSVRANPFVRETVTDQLRRSKRDATGTELRGLAYRMGIPV